MSFWQREFLKGKLEDYLVFLHVSLDPKPYF